MNDSMLMEQLHRLPDYLSAHLLLTIVALAVGVVVCIPLGFLVTRVKALQWPTLSVVGVLQTIPGIALLALMVPLLGMIGFVPALIALSIYSFLPILRNTVTGVLGVDGSIVEAARGIGMTDRQLLFRVELPLALPVIVAGVRTATVWIVGTATLATPVGATSLGNYIFGGLQTQNITAVLVGCISAALLAIILDQIVRLVEVAATRRNFRLGALATLLLLLLFALGIGPSLAERLADNNRKVIIGAKTFTEQYILANLITKLLDEEGIAAESRAGMGSIILFDALASGGVDCYVDYSGTVWANAMKREVVPSRDTLLAEMTDWLRDVKGIRNLGALGFENTYALAVTRETAKKYGLRSISDLSAVAPQLSIGSDYEFFSRPEWSAFKATYRFDFNDHLSIDPALMYSAVSEGETDVITAFSTDGRIIDYDLVLLTDDRQVFPPYDAVLLVSETAADNEPLLSALQSLVNGISDQQMQVANKIVDVDGFSVDSAATYLLHQLEGD